MGKYKFGGGYEPITPGRDSYQLDQRSIDRRELELDAQEAKRRREQERAAFLSKYADDPVSQAIAFADYELQQEEAEKTRQQQELDNIAKEHDDPVMKMWSIGQHLMKQTDAPEAQQAFNDRERLEQIRNQQRQVNQLNSVSDNAFFRESVGSAVQTVPNLAAAVARLSGEGETADQLYRESGQFGQAREEARQDDMSPYLSRMYGGASQSFLQMAATPGGAGSKIAGAGLMSGSEALTTAEDAGLTGNDRLMYAGTQGLLESGIAALGQKLFGGGVESRMAGQSVAATTFRQLAKNIGTDAAKEIPEEVITTVLQDLSSKYQGVSPDLTIEDFIANAADSAVQSIMMAGFGNAPNAIQLATRRNQQQPPGDRTPPPAASPDPEPVTPEEIAFTDNPSRSKYEAAVKAGMPPIPDAKNGKNRAAYAEERRQRRPAADPVSPDPAPLDPPTNTATVDRPMSDPAPMDAPTGTVPDPMFDEVFNLLRRGNENEDAENTSFSQGQQGDQGSQGGQGFEGRQEGLLNDAPAGPQDVATPAGSQDVVQPAAHTRESFEAEYRDTFEKLMQYSPDQAGSQVYAERMADLYDLNPDWADEIENTLPRDNTMASPSTVEPDGTSPGQSDPSTAGQVPQTRTVLRGEKEWMNTPVERFKREPTQRRLKRAEQAIERLKQKYPLFADEVAAQEGTPEQRIDRIDTENADRWEARDAEDKALFASAVQKIEQLPPEMVEDVKAGWNTAQEDTSGGRIANYVNRIETGKTRAFKGIAHPEIQDAEVRGIAERIERTRAIIADMNKPNMVPEFKQNIERQQKQLISDLQELGVTPNEVGYYPPISNKPPGAPKRYQSAIKKYPPQIPDPYSPERLVDAPPIYLTGVSNQESREAAKSMPNLGVMLTPRTQQYKTHLKDYQFFGVDNGAFTGKFNEKGFYKLLDDIREQGDAEKALFVAAPDVVGDWQATLKASEPHLDRIRDAGFPVAIVLQNGATPDTIPWDRIDALFVGGDDNFKLAQKDESGKLDRDAEMLPIIKEAKKRDVPIHYGRVNSAKRLETVHYGMRGRSVDGTFIKFGQAEAQVEKVMSWLRPWGKFPEKTQENEPSASHPTMSGEKNPEKKTNLSDARSLRAIVKGLGGISAAQLRKDYNLKELKSNGLLSVMRVKGQSLDTIAQWLETSGDLRTPSNRNPADFLMEQLLANADGARAEYSDKEIEAQLEKERAEYERLKETLKDAGIDSAGLEELRQNSIEAGFTQGEELSDEEAQGLIDISFDFGANVAARAGDIVEFTVRGEKKVGLVTKVRPDGRATVETERRTDNVGRPTSTRYEGAEFLSAGEYTKIGTSPFPATLNQFYSKWEGESEQKIESEFASMWDSLDEDDKGRLAGLLRKFGISAKVNSATAKLSSAVAKRLVNSREIPGKIREIYDIAMEYPNLQGSMEDPEVAASLREMYVRIESIGLKLPPMVNAAMILPEMRRELLYDMAKTQFGSDVADNLFSDVEEVATDAEDGFKLEPPPKPKPKPTDFGTNDNTKQGGLFDAGKPGELPGQNLLFDSDPGDVGNPKTQENKPKAEKPAAADSQKEPSQEDLMEQILRDEFAEKPAKERKPRTPKPGKRVTNPDGSYYNETAEPKKPRSEAAKKKSQKAKQELDDALEDFGSSFGATAPMGLSPEQMRAAARLVKAAIKNGVAKFDEFVAFVVDKFDEATAIRAAEGIELAWRTLKRLPEFSAIDNAGTVADSISRRKEANNDNKTTAPDEGMGDESGESGGTLATEAGSAPGDGETETGTGSDVDAISDGVDVTEGEESDSDGDGSDGVGTEQNAGAKPKPGRKSTKRPYKSRVDRLPKPVGSPINLRIQPDETIAPSGVVGKLKANVAAIKLLKQLQSEKRQATSDEQRVLMQYTGWGSLPNVFDDNRGKEYLERPGLPEQYGNYYKKSLLYQKEGQYASLDELRKRVESWEKQWGESYKFLKETLTADEWKRAKASVLNAHFTSRDVITNGIWGALEQMGVTGGRFLEPSSGIGSLIGLMPESIANDSEVMAIELDTLTGEMVRQLYPDADVHVKGFEDVPIPAGTIDVAATNVPFHKVGPADAKTRYGREMNLHNYFIARILDSLRPGGIAAVITTHFTMDANPQDRALLASKADLVGAIRLPNSAFKANAGTEVTTDILFFRKPDGSKFKAESWQNLQSVGTYEFMKAKTKKGPPVRHEGTITVNEYFAAHPEMVLGTHSMDGKQYSDTEYTVMPIEGESLAEQLQKAVKNLPADLANTDNAPLMPSLDTGTTGVEGRIELRGGKLQELSGGQWIAPSWLKIHIDTTKAGKPRKISPETRAKNLAEAMTQGIAYTKIRNAYEVHLANMRDASTTEAEYLKSQKALNAAYDAYREKHGAINDTASSWLSRDPGFFFVSGLETETDSIKNGKVETVFGKSDIFRQRTINPDSAPTKADTTEDAVKMSLAWRGAINLPWMSELTGKLEEDLETELLETGTVFLNPETSLLEPADTYLAGNVQAKLRMAEKAVSEGDDRFERNVELLREVQPPKRTIDSITPSLGQDWVPFEVVDRWLAEVVKLPSANVQYNAKADIWSIDTGAIPRDVQNEWGTLGMHLSDLLPKVLNNSTIRVTKKELVVGEDGKMREKTVTDEAQTQAAQTKAEKMRDSFESWAKADEKAIPLIEQAFNEQKNFYVKPKYNGEHLTFPGMSEFWLKRMRPYQKNTVWRAIREGRGMIAHGVGAGKTAELIATAMEMKRLGTATKPLIVVQNSTLGQFARTFTEVYPAAKVLVASKDDLNPENRAKFMARIATGNWDAIVMAKSTFNMKLPNDPTLEKKMVDGLIAELETVMLEAELADGKGAPSVKAIQQQINSLINRLEKITKRINEHTDSDVYFEQMGVDALFLDEAHDYKKPPFVTKIDRSIKGLATEVSGRALSALIKMRFIQDNNKGRNTFMATGTPITNTLGESWLLMSMVAPDVLKEFGVTTFDRFVATFARVMTSLEANAVGKLQRVTRLAKFKNGHQLAQFIQSGWDVLLGSELHDKIRHYGGGKVPKMENGKETLVMVDRSPSFDTFGKFFLDVYQAFKGLTGEDKRTYSWIPVVIYGAAKAAAIDVRLVDPTAPDDPGSKLNKMVEGVYQEYLDGTNVTLKSGDETLKGQNLTQLIFSDVSGRTDTSKLRSFAAGEGVTMEVDEDGDVNDDSEAGSDESGDEPSADGKKRKKDRWLYNEIKRKLIEKGIPESQVQLINDHNGTAEKLLEFQDRVNAGEVRIVIGHSDTLGTGVNVQTRLRAVWELDIPMVPAKREQRLGRMIRSGNLNEEVKSFVMAMQKSLDSNLMSMNLRKAKAAEQALSGKLGAEFDDPYSESLMSMADMEAAMNDDPLFYRQRDLEFQVRQRRLDVEALDQQRSRERSRLRQNEYAIESLKANIADQTKVWNKIETVLKADHPYKVEGKQIPVLKEAEKSLKENFDKESERISKASQDSKIKALSNYELHDADHVAADAEYGPIQFNLVYGERPEVLLDAKGNPYTKWTSTSGTIITMDGKKVDSTRATTLGSIMKNLKEGISETAKWVEVKQKEITSLTAENVKLAEFLAKPSDAQVELDNLQSQLDQVNALMFERDNPAPPAATPDPATGSAKAREELEKLREINAVHDKVILREWKRVIWGRAPGSGIVITDELARAIAGRIVGTVRAGFKQFEVIIRDLRTSGNLTDEVIIGIKPILIRTWNSLKEKYDLDDATSVGFDAAMSDTEDVEIEQAAEVAKGESPIADPSTPPAESEAAAADEPDRLYSTMNAFSASERDRLGMKERPKVPTLARNPSVNAARVIGQTKRGSEMIDELIEELSKAPRAVTPRENDLLNYRNAELGEKLDAAFRKRIKARKDKDDGQQAIAEQEISYFKAQKKRLIEAVLEPIGTAAGRSLQARKAIINQDFTLQRLALEFESAYDREPTAAELQKMQTQIDELDALIADLQTQLDEQQARNEDLEARLTKAHAAAGSRKPKPNPTPEKPARPSMMERLAQEGKQQVETAFEKLAAMKGKFYSLEAATADFLEALTDLAMGYSKQGVVQLADFLSRVRKRFGPDTDKILQPLTEAFNKVKATQSKDTLDEIIGSLDLDDPETIGRAARDLHRFVIERDGLDASAAGRDAAVDAVFDILETYVPGLTRDETARAMSGIGIYSELSKDEIEVIRRDQKAQLLSLEQIADWKKGQAPPATGRERPPVSDEQRELRKLVNEAKKAAGIVTTTEGQLRSALDAAKRLAKNRITDLTKALTDNQRISRSQKLLTPDAELTALRAERDALQKQYDETFGRPEMSEEQRQNMAEKLLDRAIAKMEADLKAGKLYADPRRPTLSGEALEAKRAELAALKASREEMRISSGEAQARSDAAYERRLLERDAELARRLAAGEFMPAEKKPAREFTPSMLKVMLAIEKKRQELRKQQRDWEFKNRHIVYKALVKGPVAAANIIRKGLTTIDQSLIGRQGFLLGITHPFIYGKAITKAFGSNWMKGKSIFPTEQDLFDTQTALDADANWVRLEKRAKLAVTDVHGGMKREEGNEFAPEWIDKVWGVGGSERAGSAFINTQRRLVFRSLVEKLSTKLEADGERTISDAELRVIANLVNVSTGRATFGRFENALEVATMVFFSPRWWVSRLQWLTGQPIWKDSTWFGGEGASREVRAMVAGEMAKQAAAQMAIMGITIAGMMAAFGEPGDDEEWNWYADPRNPDFGKIRVGQTLVDMTAGLGQHASLVGRMLTGTEIRRWEAPKDAKRGTTMLTYGRGKLAPIPSMVGDWLSDNQKSMSGKAAGSQEWFVDRLAPLILQDVTETTKTEGIPLGPVLSLLMFFGIGAQTREERVKKRGDLANELRAAKRQGKPPETIQRIVEEHLKNAAGEEAKEKLRTADPEDTAALQQVIAQEESPELADAMQKERYDIALRAIEMLSSEDRTGQRGTADDKGIQTARDILLQIAPTYEKANELFTEAYRKRHGSVVEMRGGRRVPKQSVTASRRRLRAMYPN